MMENLCHRFGLGFQDAYDRVKWKKISDPLEKGKMLTIIN